jgi:hypothetical protein
MTLTECMPTATNQLRASWAAAMPFSIWHSNQLCPPSLRQANHYEILAELRRAL